MTKYRFNSITPELITRRKLVHDHCRQFSRSPSKGNLKRIKTLLGRCGEEVFIEAGVHMDYGENIIIGDRVFINSNVTFIDSPFIAANNSELSNIEANNNELSNIEVNSADSLIGQNKVDPALQLGEIRLGDDCLIGPNVQFLAVSHDIDPALRKAHKYNYADNITLGNNIWLGAGVIVLAGISIGENSVVGAGSVVCKDIPANTFVAGNPAVKIRDI